MKKWYNCWLFHSWGDWQQAMGKSRAFWEKEDSDCVFQKRYCLACKKMELQIL